MASGAGRRARPRGRVEELPSGSLRVVVYAGVDPVTKRRHYLREIVPAGPKAADQAQKAMRRLANQVDERRHPRTTATVGQLLDRHFELVDLERSTLATYQGYADKHIRPLLGAVQLGALDADVFDSFYGELRRCREHCDRRPYIEHRTSREHECDRRCRPHSCTPLGASTVRQVHFILSGALKRAVRWRWLSANPITQAEPPAAPKPNPQPPTAQEAARILAEAWREPDWGTLVWLAMVTGLRRGELCGLRWRHVDLDAGVLSVTRSIGQRSGQMWEKDTKSHQQRRIALDRETLGLLGEHRARCAERAAAVGVDLPEDAFLFSLAPDGSTHLQPNSVSQRYGVLAARLGIATSIHKLRHFSATELIAAGVDVRTVAGRLGHGGGGTTTLKVYAAFVSESDQRAASSLFARMPTRPAEPSLPRPRIERPPHPYEKVAAGLREAIEAGALPIGAFLPGLKVLGATHGVSVGTAHRAVSLLAEWGYAEVVTGRGVRIVADHATLPDPGLDDAIQPEPERSAQSDLLVPGEPRSASPTRQLLDLEVRHGAEVLARLTTEADPRDPVELRELLLDALRRRGRDESTAHEYELDMRVAGDSSLLTTFVLSRRR